MRDFSVDLVWAKLQLAFAGIGGWLGYFIGGMGSGAPFGGGGGGGGYTESYVGGFPGGGGGGSGGSATPKAGARGADGCILITW